jgi:hypothetical protein
VIETTCSYVVVPPRLEFMKFIDTYFNITVCVTHCFTVIPKHIFQSESNRKLRMLSKISVKISVREKLFLPL